ncbi:MAG TPA: hypothetical protein VHE30_19080 [Polyangiaceae bacterium]|nr:hypothetical protein [Polyangiaceae bacterium]
MPGVNVPRRGKPPSGKPLLFLLGGLIALVGAGLVYFVFASREAPRAPSPRAASSEPLVPESLQPIPAPAERVVTAPSSPAPAATPSPAPVPEPPVVDLLAGDVPPELEVGRQVVERGGMIFSSRLKAVYEYGKTHPGDARPHLILGRDSMARGWLGFAADHYVRAVKEDPRAAGDPKMFDDLITVSAMKQYETRGTDAIRTIYGGAAVPKLERALADATAAGDAGRAELLSRLIADVAAPPNPTTPK